MIVTAEPHFMVTSPSRFIVLSNAPDDAGDAAALRYVGDEGVYNYTNTRLTHAPESSGDIQTGVRQANVAVQLAERAGAAQFAPGELAEARKALDAMILAVEDGALDRSGGLLARDAIRIAARAEKLAKAGVAAAAMESERQEFRNALARLNQELDATRITLEREIAMAEGRQVRLEVALEAARERTAEALDRILDTRETAQGLIVSLPDVLFDTGQSTLKVETREALARVAGILQLIPGFQIQVEGHTDDVGSAAYNQSLAGDRAVSVQNYLVGAGVPASNVRVVAFGESRPLASNLTAEGREKNRRVELVITDVASQAALLPEE
jgi:outer membrane protein OmpA-like peptidoglycan-associated protein